MDDSFIPMPAKRYFTISEVSKLCGVKAHVLRYWEREFTQLRPVKRRGNRRYYQLYEVKLICQIRQLLYEHGFTIVGARNRLQEFAESVSIADFESDPIFLQCKLQEKQNDNPSSSVLGISTPSAANAQNMTLEIPLDSDPKVTMLLLASVRFELINIRDDLLGPVF